MGYETTIAQVGSSVAYYRLVFSECSVGPNSLIPVNYGYMCPCNQLVALMLKTQKSWHRWAAAKSLATKWFKPVQMLLEEKLWEEIEGKGLLAFGENFG